MKKLVLVLVLVFALAIPALANPFVDVPLNHWAYDAVQTLAAKGVVIGYPDGTFGGQRMLTRYEFAEAVARVLAHVEQYGGLAEDVEILSKLAVEFADELATLGVTVADLKAAVGEHKEAIDAMQETVDKHEKFFEPVTITGKWTADYEKVVMPVGVATLTDTAELTFTAEINPETTAAVTLSAENLINAAGVTNTTVSGYDLKYAGDWSLWVSDGVEPATIGLGLIYDYDTNEDFPGVWAQWQWDVEDTDMGTWTMFMDVEDFYVLNVALNAGDDDDVPVGVTASFDPLAGGFAGGADISFGIGDQDEATMALEAGVFYDIATAAISYAGAAQMVGSFDDFDVTVDGYYAQLGFVPTNSAYTADVAGVDVEVGFPINDEDADTQIAMKANWTYEMDAAFAANVTHDIGASLNFTIDEATSETAMVGATYDVLTGGILVEGEYLNLPLGENDEGETDFVLSAHADYDTALAAYMAVATLVYDFDDDMDLILEGRLDSDGVGAMYSAEAKLLYNVAENTDLHVGFEFNDWSDDINDWDDYNIVGTDSTLYAGVEVSF